MGLQAGNTRAIKSRNIAKLEREGYPHTQAVAIALRYARKTAKQPPTGAEGCLIVVSVCDGVVVPAQTTPSRV